MLQHWSGDTQLDLICQKHADFLGYGVVRSRTPFPVAKLLTNEFARRGRKLAASDNPGRCVVTRDAVRSDELEAIFRPQRTRGLRRLVTIENADLEAFGLPELEGDGTPAVVLHCIAA